MTVNKRLFAVGLLAAYNEGAAAGDEACADALLMKVGLLLHAAGMHRSAEPRA